MSCKFEFYEMLQPKSAEVFPEQLQKYTLPSTNYGTPNKKRIRVLPFTIDTFGQNVTFTPNVDCVDTPSTVFNTSCKDTVFHFFKTDVFGVDYTGSFVASGTNVFELWQVHDPTIVQVLPIAKQFDQIGPEELFEYSKIRAFEIRLLAFGGTVIPFSMFFQDDTPVYTGNITVIDGKENSYRISVPKTVAGEILRLELGPTNFDFHRIYGRFQIMRQGRVNTENEWIILGSQNEK